MNLQRSALLGLRLALGAAALAASAPAQRAPEAVSSPPTPSDPLSLEDLEALQENVDRVVVRASAATVGIQVGGARGTGILVSADGLVMSAAHVTTSPGARAKVSLPDGREFDAVALGCNPTRDASLMRIEDGTDLPFVHVPLPRDATVGEWCIALGHHGGFDAERAPVVRLGRVTEVRGRFLRSDCALIGGDSGGPLFDLEGNLIGIHSRIQADVAENFHVPMSAFRLGWLRLLASEEWTRGDAVMGFRRHARFEVRDPRGGIRVGEVPEGGPAAGAGLVQGDVLRRINGERVYDADNLGWLMADLSPGQRVSLAIERDGVARQVELTLGRRGETRPASGEEQPQEQGGR